MEEKNYCVIAKPQNTMEKLAYLTKFKDTMFFYDDADSAHSAAAKLLKRARKLDIGVEFKVVRRKVKPEDSQQNETI